MFYCVVTAVLKKSVATATQNKWNETDLCPLLNAEETKSMITVVRLAKHVVQFLEADWALLHIILTVMRIICVHATPAALL